MYEINTENSITTFRFDINEEKDENIESYFAY